MSSYLLDSTLNKLRRISLGLKERDQMFLNKCIDVEMNKNHLKAIIYANECVEIRKLARLVRNSELALEQAILRLQTINEVNNVEVAINPIVSIIKETKGKLAGIIPSAANRLDEINTVLRSNMSEMKLIYSSEASVVQSNEEAKKILKEANQAAEGRIRERFPGLPEELEAFNDISEDRIPIALTALGVPADVVKAISRDGLQTD